MRTVTVSAKGRIVIPKDLREKYGLTGETQVQIVEYGHSLALVPLPDDPVEALAGMLVNGPSLTDALLSERSRRGTIQELRS